MGAVTALRARAVLCCVRIGTGARGGTWIARPSRAASREEREVRRPRRRSATGRSRSGPRRSRRVRASGHVTSSREAYGAEDGELHEKPEPAAHHDRAARALGLEVGRPRRAPGRPRGAFPLRRAAAGPECGGPSANGPGLTAPGADSSPPRQRTRQRERQGAEPVAVGKRGPAPGRTGASSRGRSKSIQ